MNVKKMLITGASGFLGGHILFKAQNRFQTVGTYWHNSPMRISSIWQRINLSDEPNIRTFLSDYQPDVIIHSAANSNLDECESDPNAAHKINVASTQWLAEYSAKKGVRLIFVSSDMVFNGNRGMYAEENKTSPLAYYGASKVKAEQEVREKCKNYVIARSALIYGRPKTSSSSFSVWMESKLKLNNKIGLYTDQYRTPIYVENIADALLELAENNFCGTLHLGGANRINRYDFGLDLCSVCGYNKDLLVPSSMSDATAIAPRPKDVSLAIDKAKTVLKTKLLSTKEGLEQMVNTR